MQQQYIRKIFLPIIISMILALILFVAIWAGYRELFFLNFHSGEFRKIITLFSIPVYKTQTRGDFITGFFSEEERRRMPDEWMPHATGYYNNIFQYRILNGIGLNITKEMYFFSVYSNVFTEQEKAAFRSQIIHSINTSCTDSNEADWIIVMSGNQMADIVRERK